jgi:hypothetical protein
MTGCARPTCAGDAEVGLGYDAVNRVAWLVTLDGQPENLLGLCVRHAERVTLPAGWVGRDDRSGDPTLWLPAAGPSSAGGADVTRLPAAPRGAHPLVPDDEAVVVEELPLWSDERHDPAAHLAEDLYRDHQRTLREPDGRPDDAAPHSPLLTRAFRAAGLG